VLRRRERERVDRDLRIVQLSNPTVMYSIMSINYDIYIFFNTITHYMFDRKNLSF
jgi:hypothetical protein